MVWEGGCGWGDVRSRRGGGVSRIGVAGVVVCDGVVVGVGSVVGGVDVASGVVGGVVVVVVGAGGVHLGV